MWGARTSANQISFSRGSRRLLVKIVVADDCPEMRRLIRSVLPVETEVFECPDGRTALQACRNHAPDWALLDIAMAPLDGISAAQQLRESTSDVRIIFVTAHDESRWRDAAADLGVCGYVLKDALEQINQIIASFDRNQIAADADKNSIKHSKIQQSL